MEYNFENKFVIDRPIMTETVRSNRKVFTTISAIPTVITGLGILSILARAVVQSYLDLPMLLRWTIFFLLFLRISTTPGRTARRVIKDFKRMYQVDSIEATTQFGEKISYTLQGSETCEYDYDCITKVISAKNSYILCFKKKVLTGDVDRKGNALSVTKKGSIPVVRDAFTKGDFASFKEFFRAKRPDLKIPE